MSYLIADASRVKFVINAILGQYPELADDETLRADSLEAETDMHKVISRALKERLEAASLAEATKTRITDLSDRKARFERKADAMKDLIKGLMDAADLDKMTLPEATLSVTAPRASVNVLDINELPQGYYAVERKADKTAIKKAIEAGETIPGAELQIGLSGLTIRTK